MKTYSQLPGPLRENYDEAWVCAEQLRSVVERLGNLGDFTSEDRAALAEAKRVAYRISNRHAAKALNWLRQP